jgi:predicted dehydrogenase
VSSSGLHSERRLRAGIVGGGRGAFIGAVHRMAAELDGQVEIVAGALSSDPQTARQSAADWFLQRAYTSFEEMAHAEAAAPDGIDFVIVAVPNHLHYPVVRAFLAAGIHVVCDKPLALSVAEGEQLAPLLASGSLLFALTQTYTGYPAVREARALVAAGELGRLHRVMVEYTQDWLREPLETQGQKQAAWRTDPARSGPAGSVGDIGVHAQNLLEYVSGQHIASVCADLNSVVAGRQLDDDASILLRLSGGARGVLVCSQIATGDENALSLRLYGSKAGLGWHHEDPDTLIHKPAGAPWRRLRRGHGYLSDAARAASRLPPGHPEGYIEAFANLYRAFVADVRRLKAGAAALRDYPGLEEGLRSLRFIEAVVASSRANSAWTAVGTGR